MSYWTTNHDTCSAECTAQWYVDDDTRKAVWDKFAKGPEPVGYDPYIIPMWSDGPTSEHFAALRLTPYRLRVMPGTVMTNGRGRAAHLASRLTTSYARRSSSAEGVLISPNA